MFVGTKEDDAEINGVRNEDSIWTVKWIYRESLGI